MKEYEALNDDYFFEKWHFIEDDSVTEDDNRFKKLIDRYRLELNKFDGNAYRDILAVIQLVEEGATFTSRKLKSKSSNSEYANSFFIVIDNSDKLIDIGAKIFVFDGTADIDPDYDRGFINMVVKLIPATERLTQKQVQEYVDRLNESQRQISAYKSKAEEAESLRQRTLTGKLSRGDSVAPLAKQVEEIYKVHEAEMKRTKALQQRYEDAIKQSNEIVDYVKEILANNGVDVSNL